MAEPEATPTDNQKRRGAEETSEFHDHIIMDPTKGEIIVPSSLLASIKDLPDWAPPLRPSKFRHGDVEGVDS